GILSQFEKNLSLVLVEEVQGDSVLSLRDNVVEVVQDNMVGDEDYHDVVTERHHMKAKGRPKKKIDSRMIESDYDDSDELLEGGTDSEDDVEYKKYDAENDNPILEVGMKFANFD
ncbi:hypothetical protein H5410_026959, partial [Solanum commersonii]